MRHDPDQGGSLGLEGLDLGGLTGFPAVPSLSHLVNSVLPSDASKLPPISLRSIFIPTNAY